MIGFQPEFEIIMFLNEISKSFFYKEIHFCFVPEVKVGVQKLVDIRYKGYVKYVKYNNHTGDISVCLLVEELINSLIILIFSSSSI